MCMLTDKKTFLYTIFATRITKNDYTSEESGFKHAGKNYSKGNTFLLMAFLIKSVLLYIV